MLLDRAERDEGSPAFPSRFLPHGPPVWDPISPPKREVGGPATGPSTQEMLSDAGCVLAGRLCALRAGGLCGAWAGCPHPPAGRTAGHPEPCSASCLRREQGVEVGCLPRKAPPGIVLSEPGTPLSPRDRALSGIPPSRASSAQGLFLWRESLSPFGQGESLGELKAKAIQMQNWATARGEGRTSLSRRPRRAAFMLIYSWVKSNRSQWWGPGT